MGANKASLENAAVYPPSHRRRYESPRQRERQRTILATARELLDAQGYAGMTMRELARSAGVAQGTLYNLYSSKDELIVAAVDDLLLELGEHAAAIEVPVGFESIISLAGIMGGQIVRAPKYADAICRALFNAQPDDPIVDVTFGRFGPLVERHLHQAAARGQLIDGIATDLLAKHLVGQNWSVILLWLMGSLPIEQLETENRRSQIMTLAGVASPAAQGLLREMLADL